MHFVVVLLYAYLANVCIVIHLLASYHVMHVVSVDEDVVYHIVAEQEEKD